MRFAITHNNFNPDGGGGVLPPLRAGQSARTNQTKQINRFCRCFVLWVVKVSTEKQNATTKQINRQK